MQHISGDQVGAIFLKIFFTLVVVVFAHYPFFGQTFSESFENGIRDEYWAFEGHHNSVSSEHSLNGSKSYRSWLPIKNYSNARSEIRFRGGKGVPHFQTNKNTFGTRFAIYFPKDFQPDESSAEIIAQYHSVPDKEDTYSSPPWALRLRGKTLSVTNRWISKRIASNADQREKTWTLSEKIVPGKWHYFVVDVHWDYNSNGNGFMKFYMKVGEPPTASDIKINYGGPTGYNDNLGPYLKFGVYKWDWKQQSRVSLSRRQGVTERLLFYDDIAVKKNGFLSNSSPQVNKEPSANAGSDLSVSLDEQTEVTITGSGNDPDGEIRRYRWTQVSGPGDLTLVNQSAAEVTFQNLEEGVYILRLTVTDDNGATDTDDMVLTVKSSDNSPPTTNAGANITLVLPENSVEITGITSDPDADDTVEEHIWTQSDGPTTVTIENPESLTIRLENLVAGRYVFKLKAYDKSGAEGSDHISVFVLNPEDLPSISAQVTDASCNAKDGAIKLTVAGNSSPYTYLWSNGATSKDLSNVPNGQYEVVVTGNNGWSSSKTLVVGGITTNLKAEAEIKDAHCSSNDGAIKLQVTGGQEPYEFEWNNSAARGSDLNNLAAGTYNVTVTDQNGCSKKFSYTVDVTPGPTQFEVDATIENASCAGNDGSIQLKVNGHSGPYSFRWTHNETGASLSSLEDGVYSVIITDKHGCYMDKTFTVNQDPGLAKPRIEQSEDTLFVTQNASGYQWFNGGERIEGATGSSLKIVEPGTYSIQINNAQGCTASSDYFDAADPRPYARSLDPNLTFQQFEFYPNPVVVDMKVEMVVSKPTTIVLDVLDFQGRKIQTEDLGLVHSQVSKDLNVASYPAGIYLLRAKAGDEIITRRFVKP